MCVKLIRKKYRLETCVCVCACVRACVCETHKEVSEDGDL